MATHTEGGVRRVRWRVLGRSVSGVDIRRAPWRATPWGLSQVGAISRVAVVASPIATPTLVGPSPGSGPLAGPARSKSRPLPFALAFGALRPAVGLSSRSKSRQL